MSYGEETITETNILEIRRRHPKLVRVWTFPKHIEAKNGADWEWHIVGRRRTLKMRVQAKRIQRNGILKVKHKVRSSGEQQRSLLIGGAQAAEMKAVYCIYCTEPQRSFWRETRPPLGYRSFQAGCLLADAKHVLPTTTRLGEIEEKCRPWHYLFAPAVLMQEESVYYLQQATDFVRFVSAKHPRHPLIEVSEVPERFSKSSWRFPTVDDLNHDESQDFDWTGVRETNEEDLARLGPDAESGSSLMPFEEERLRDLGIHLMLIMDVRGDTELDELHLLRRL